MLLYFAIMSKVQLVNDFNIMAIDLATQISALCPTSLIANNIDVLKQLISKNNKSVKTSQETGRNSKEVIKKVQTIYDKKIRDGYFEIDLPENMLTFEALNKIEFDDTKNANGFIIPAKCKPYVDGVMTFPIFAQAKLNGFRGEIRKVVKPSLDLFETNNEIIEFRNKTGLPLQFDHLVEECYHLFEKYYYIFGDTADELILDGEFYIHGQPLGRINSAVNDINDELHSSIEFHIFDIKTKTMPQYIRFKLLDRLLDGFPNYISLKYVKPQTITNESETLRVRDFYISSGYEGAVFRDKNAFYSSSRTKNWMKYKKVNSIICEITGVVPYKKQPKTAMFEVKDLTNDTVIEAVIKSSSPYTTAIREEVMLNPSFYIGKFILIEYRERTEAGKLFHTNAVFETLRTHFDN